MSKLRVLDLFSGIGGFSLGLERSLTPCGNQGFETVAFCEIEPYPRRVLAKHWPEVPQYEDVTTLTGDILRRDGIAVDVITGGFPCQDISCAGKQAGIKEGTRSGLWSEIVRLIGELSPRYVIVENVAALLSGPSEQRGGWFGRILSDLAECGYDAEWENIPAAAVGAHHRRERVWIVAYPNRDGLETEPTKEILFNAAGNSRLPRRLSEMDSPKIWLGPRPIGAVPMALGNGLPEWLGDVKAAGNAVVPQIPELIGNAILAAEAPS